MQRWNGTSINSKLKKKHIKNTFFPGFVNWWLKPHAPGFNINIKYSVCFPVTTRNTWRRYLLASVGPWHSLFSSSLEKWAELAAPPVICTNTLPPFFFSPPLETFRLCASGMYGFWGPSSDDYTRCVAFNWCRNQKQSAAKGEAPRLEMRAAVKWSSSLDGDVRWRLAVISTDSETKEELGALINVKGAGLGGRWGGSVFPFSLSLTLLALEYVS